MTFFVELDKAQMGSIAKVASLTRSNKYIYKTQFIFIEFTKTGMFSFATDGFVALRSFLYMNTEDLYGVSFSIRGDVFKEVNKIKSYPVEVELGLDSYKVKCSNYLTEYKRPVQYLSWEDLMLSNTNIIGSVSRDSLLYILKEELPKSTNIDLNFSDKGFVTVDNTIKLNAGDVSKDISIKLDRKRLIGLLSKFPKKVGLIFYKVSNANTIHIQAYENTSIEAVTMALK